jgi:hypothetical protein
MDHAACMRECDRLADVPEQREASRQRQRGVHAVPIERFALDVLHREPRPAPGAASAVQQARDVRVAQVGQGLAFAPEQGLAGVVGLSGVHPLERHLLLVLAVVAFGQVDDGHAAAPQFAQHAIDADAFARAQFRVSLALAQQGRSHRTLQGAAGLENARVDGHGGSVSPDGKTRCPLP